MESRDVLQLLQYYRHDYLNHLQIIQGYTSMNQTDKVMEKIEHVLISYEKERKLIQLGIPEFALWLIRLNWYEENFNFNYEIKMEKNDKRLHAVDVALTNQCKQVINAIKNMSNSDTYHEGTIQLSEYEDKGVLISISFQGTNENYNALMSMLTKDGSKYAITKERDIITIQFIITYK